MFYAWVLIVLGIIIVPVTLFIFKKYIVRHFILDIFLLFLSPLIILKLVVLGLESEPCLFSNITIQSILYIICLFEIIFLYLCLLVYSCFVGMIFLKDLKKNKYVKASGVKFLISLFMIIVYLVYPNIIFSMLYNFSGIPQEGYFQLNTYDAFFYSLAVNYQIPLTGIFFQFQQLVNSSGMLRTVQIIHLIFARLVDLIVISFIINEISQLLQKDVDETQSISQEPLGPRSKKKKRHRYP